MVPRLEPRFKLERGHSTELSLDDLDVEPGNSREVRGASPGSAATPRHQARGRYPKLDFPMTRNKARSSCS
jgi:hypothetical protein